MAHDLLLVEGARVRRANGSRILRESDGYDILLALPERRGPYGKVGCTHTDRKLRALMEGEEAINSEDRVSYSFAH